MTLELPPLPYAYEALQPYMSRETLEYHHDKHHMAYVTQGNKLAEEAGLSGKSVEDLMHASFGKNAPLFNNAGQHFNHLHFWQWLKPNGGGNKLPAALASKVEQELGGFDAFRASFIQAGMTQFGSGWCWLALKNGKLEVMKTPNGENPLMHGATPLLGCDVWEHSYYIDYRNARQKYLEAFMDNMVNWDYVAHLFETASKKGLSA
ncbi:MAG: superoxide dismutase [Alphaproteobacteria bacterium]